MPSQVSVKELLESGVHFGHKSSRWNPKMRPYIYGKRNVIHIINLKETVKGLVNAMTYLYRLAAKGEDILFVGTKRAARTVIADQARKCGMPFVSERWIGGTLTNYSTIRSRLERLLEIEKLETEGTLALYGKKEMSQILREKRKLKRNLDGIRNMTRLPAAMIVIDPKKEKNAVQEARRMGLATVALIDTDGDPDVVDFVIPGNDDAMRVIQIIATKLSEAIAEGKAQAPAVTRPKEEPKSSSQSAASTAEGRERQGGRGGRGGGRGGGHGGGHGGGRGGGGRGRGGPGG
ncbi:MAG: 30S ribosomal protein S2, partial [Planctomycetes bacterium]|nr:30S ribosomal protein S2 [Planctomycetota bacterium]